MFSPQLSNHLPYSSHSYSFSYNTQITIAQMFVGNRILYFRIGLKYSKWDNLGLFPPLPMQDVHNTAGYVLNVGQQILERFLSKGRFKTRASC